MLHMQYHNKQWIKATLIKRALVLWCTVAATESKVTIQQCRTVPFWLVRHLVHPLILPPGT